MVPLTNPGMLDSHADCMFLSIFSSISFEIEKIRLTLLSADCTPATEIFRKLSPHLGKWERCDLGGKHRARYCYLLLAPPFRLTPNETKGVVPTKEFSKALKLLKCFT